MSVAPDVSSSSQDDCMKYYNPILQHTMSKHGVRCIPDNMLYTSVNE